MHNSTLVLASSSRYRQSLLSRLGLPFQTHSPDIDESAHPGEHPAQTCLRLSIEKARAVAPLFSNALIIGSDQVAHMGDTIFQKPGTYQNAVAQLNCMSGQTVDFDTGLCVLNSNTDEYHSKIISTRVTFRTLTPTEIDTYLRTEQPYDCAGSAKSEGLGITLIQSIEGTDPNALIGLPLIALCDLLRLHHLNPLLHRHTPLTTQPL